MIEMLENYIKRQAASQSISSFSSLIILPFIHLQVIWKGPLPEVIQCLQEEKKWNATRSPMPHSPLLYTAIANGVINSENTH